MAFVCTLGLTGHAKAQTYSATPRPAPHRFFDQDTTLIFHLRTFYYEGTQSAGGENEAWSGGGWVGYRSGWILENFRIGATVFGSAPLYAPEDKDGTFLLEPGQEGYVVVGEAYAALRYRDGMILKAYRQLVDQGYINPSDIRMTPFTFEGVTVGGRADSVRYLAGYLWRVKSWNEDSFISMAERAGAEGSDAGVGLVGVQLTFVPGLRVDVSNQYGFDTFNTAYARADFRQGLDADWTAGIGVEFTDQRAVGDALVANAAVNKWRTRVGAMRGQLSYRDLTLTSAFSVAGSGNDIQNPWGTYPGYLALIDAPANESFARANERAWLVGAIYESSGSVLPGTTFALNVARGTGAIDPRTRQSVADQTEYNFKIEYRPPWLAQVIERGLGLTVRGSLYDREGTDELARQIHLIFNWEWAVLTGDPK